MKIIKQIYHKLLNNRKISKTQFGQGTFITKKSVIERSLIGRKCIINDAEIYDCVIGNYSTVNSRTMMWHTKIGNFCSIGGGVKINLSSHPINLFSTHPLFYRKGYYENGLDKTLFKELDTCSIGHDVWIGENVLIKAGVSIGTGAILGACSFINRNIPPYAIAVGIPAKVIKYRFNETMIDKLLETSWWELSDEILYSIIEKIRTNSDICNPEEFLREIYLCKENVK